MDSLKMFIFAPPRIDAFQFWCPQKGGDCLGRRSSWSVLQSMHRFFGAKNFPPKLRKKPLMLVVQWVVENDVPNTLQPFTSLCRSILPKQLHPWKPTCPLKRGLSKESTLPNYVSGDTWVFGGVYLPHKSAILGSKELSAAGTTLVEQRVRRVDVRHNHL